MYVLDGRGTPASPTTGKNHNYVWRAFHAFMLNLAAFECPCPIVACSCMDVCTSSTPTPPYEHPLGCSCTLLFHTSSCSRSLRLATIYISSAHHNSRCVISLSSFSSPFPPPPSFYPPHVLTPRNNLALITAGRSGSTAFKINR